MSKILVNHGDRRVIAKIFNVSEVTVRNALKFGTNSDLAKRIRKAAIERGGVEISNTQCK